MTLSFFDRWGFLLITVVSLALGAGLCAAVLTPRYEARIAAMQRDQAQAVATARAADIETLQLAKRQGDALTARLQTTESALHVKQKDLHDAIKAQTTGRPCLYSPVVRMLNDGTAHRAADLPPPTASAFAADGATATDTAYTGDDAAFASDTDVAHWAANARTQYDICRARLDALIDFYQPTMGTP